MVLNGVGASKGIGISKAVHVVQQQLDYSQAQYAGFAAEKEKLAQAVYTFCEQTRQMAADVKCRAGEKEAEILEGQMMLLQDPFMISQMEQEMMQGAVVQAAVDRVCTSFAEMFAGMEDELMSQRAADICDIRTRLLGILLGVKPVDISKLPKGSVIVAHDLTPSMTVGIQKENVAAIVTETGGQTSHSAILARALELPAVLSVADALKKIAPDEMLIVDGEAGQVIVSPDARQLASGQQRQHELLEERAGLEFFRERETLDADGRKFLLYANIGSVQEAQAAACSGAEGIGLFRTEFLFMDRDELPGEEEQYAAYSQVSACMAGKEVIIRTLDIGGDKEIPYLHLQKEENPFLGFRAIRYCLEETGVFKTQLRALLRAGAAHHNLKLMFPLVTGAEEVRAAKKLLEECKRELRAEGKAFDGEISVGVMIETPAAALIADLLGQEADFFSIGTNDLTQYTLAVDRGNARVEELYDPLHPAVLRSIQKIIQAAKQAGIPVGMCGEAAADPRMIPLLLAFGLDEFSVGAPSVAAARKEIAGWSAWQAEALCRKVMACSTADEIKGCF